MEQEEIYSKRVKAGKRVYFFDVKSTRSGEYYVTVTESKKNLETDTYMKHKIFLYKEDFMKFSDGLHEVIDYVKENQEVVEREYKPFVRDDEQKKSTQKNENQDIDDILEL